MALTTWNQVLDLLPGQSLMLQDGSVEQIGGPWSSWSYGGANTAGPAPTTLNGDHLSGPHASAPAFVDPIAGEDTYIAAMTGRPSSSSATNVAPQAAFWIYDRLWHNLVNTTSTSLQSPAPGSLLRYTDGVGVEAWWEVFTTYGAATPTVTLTYTDQDGNTAQSGTSGALATALVGSRTGPFQLAHGDTGVRAITGWQASASFVSGTLGCVLRRKLATFTFGADWERDNRTFDAIQTFLSRVEDDAVLEVVQYNGTATTTRLTGQLHLIQG